MTTVLLVAVLISGDPPTKRLMTGTVVEVGERSITLANAKERKTFRVTADSVIVVDGAKVGEERVSVKDAATLTYDAEFDEVIKAQVSSAKLREMKSAEKKKADDEEAARREKRRKEREEKAIEEELRLEKERKEREAKAKNDPIPIKRIARGPAEFGPLMTKLGTLSVAAKPGRGGQVELTLTLDAYEAPSMKSGPRDVGGITLPGAAELKPSSVSFRSRSSSSGSIEMRSGTPPPDRKSKKKKKGNPNPDNDPENAKKVLEAMERRYAGDDVPVVKREPIATMSLSFLTPADVVIKDGDRIVVRIGDTELSCDAKHNPKVLDAFKELFQALRGP